MMKMSQTWSKFSRSDGILRMVIGLLVVLAGYAGRSDATVNHLLRTYSTAHPGLTVDTVGGSVQIDLRYDNDAWAVGPAGSGLDGATAAGGLTFQRRCAEYGTPVITSITRDGTYVYALPEEHVRIRPEYDATGNLLRQTCAYAGDQIYYHRPNSLAYLIRKTDDGYRWADKYGDWHLYAGATGDVTAGRWLASGDRRGEISHALFDADGRVSGYADRDGNQIVWFDYAVGAHGGAPVLTTIRDAGGRSVTLTYNPDGRLETVTDPEGQTTTYTYFPTGKLQQIAQPDGQQVNLTYTPAGDVATVRDETGTGYDFEFTYDKGQKEYYASVRSTEGQVKEYWYDADGNTTRLDVDGVTVQTVRKEGNAQITTDAQGRATRREYDEWENLTTVGYPDGTTTTYEYEHTYQQLLRKNDRGVISEYTYTDTGALHTLVEAKGTPREQITAYTYNADGNRSQMQLTEAVGTALENRTIEDYDADGNRTQLTEAAGTDLERVTDYAYTDGNLTRIIKHLDGGQTAVTEMQYDADGHLTWQRDPSGQETTYTYENGKIKTVETAQGTWTYGYTADRLTSVTDPFGQTRGQTYTADGQVETVTVNGQTVATYTYTNGNLTRRTDALGQATTFGYTDDGQIQWQQDAEGREQRYAYDAQGRLWKTLDGNNAAIERVYGVSDAGKWGTSCPSCSGSPLLGGGGSERLQKIIYPTFTKEFTYDDDGRVSEEIYTLGRDAPQRVSTAYTYDPFGRLETTTGPDNQTTTYTYDRSGRRIMVEDPSGQTRFEYDRWDNLTALVDAQNQRTAFEYYPDGKLKKEIRPLLQETEYTYDDRGRVWKILDANGHTTEYEYDPQSRLWKIRHSGPGVQTSVCQLSYDPDGNLSGYNDGETSATYTYNALGQKLTETVNYGAFSKSFSYSYYKNGLKQTFTAPDNTVYTYMYGNNNELQNIGIPGVGNITIPEYTWNRPKTTLFPGGTQRAATYDALMRIQALTVTDPGGNPLLNYAYTYDPIGNITAKATEHGDYAYGYDASSRLTSADNPALSDESYTYDNVGNRQTAAGVSGNWSYNSNNELLGIGGGGTPPYPAVEYTYDANGNMTQKKVGTAAVNYMYNAENRLIKVEDGLTKVVIAEYGYDPFGRRLWKEVGGTRTYFFYSEEGLIAEYDASGNELKSYGYKPDSTWGTDPLWLKENGQYYFYQNDHLGTPQKLVAQNGAVVWSASYAAFGQVHVEVETVVNNLRLPGQYFDAETGLHYNFQRYYEPGSGRYVSVDPIGFAGGDVNWYPYAESNPINVLDPKGLDPLSKTPLYDPRELEQIPRIMRHLGLEKGAGMLEQWFSRPAKRITTLPQDIVLHTDPPFITLAWILSFPRGQEAYENIIKTYKNQAAKNWIVREPQRFGIKFGNPSDFGGFKLEFPELHNHYINTRSVGDAKADPFDDLLAALGRFTLHVVITKGVKYGATLRNACLRVDEIGIYMRDSFDFEGGQPLGTWDLETNSGRKGIGVTNGDFQAYRNWYGSGGDFLVFSDVKLITVNPPEWIYLGVPGSD